MTPEWLPDLVATDGEWDTVIAGLYAVFCRDFRDGRPRLNGLPVQWDERISAEGFEEAFWHLVTADEHNVGERLFEPERARHLSWCGAVIGNAGDAAVLQWVYREKGKLRTYLWLRELDYVVVLKGVPPAAPQYYFLITAFHVSGDSQRRNMRRRYQEREP
jgi:hypothetical protein